MKNKRPETSSVVRCLMLIAASLICASCIDVDIKIQLRRNQTVELELAYRIDHDLATLGSYERRQLKSIPLEEIDFQLLVANHPDIRLQQYRQRNKKEHREITVRLRFDSTTVFNDFFRDNSVAAPLQLMITNDENGGQLLFPLASALPVDEEAAIGQLRRQFAHQFFSDNTVTLTVVAPQRITQLNNGEARGKRAAATYQLSELIATDSDIIWRVDW